MSALPHADVVAPDAMDRALALVSGDLERFHAALACELEPQRPYLTEAEYAIYRGGKKVRPLLLLLAARMFAAAEEALPERVIRAAVSLEMLHVATLIHDDIIDEAPQRRGVPSVHAARGAHVALLMGDLQFVQAVRCFASAVEVPEDMRLVLMVLDVGSDICRGELDELQTDPRSSVEELRRRYLSTIDRKTAVLFELACHSGAALMRARKRQIWKLGRYGRLLGRAFQMMDDLSDFLEPRGKVAGMDLARRRMTLPIIEALEELPGDSPLHRLMETSDRNAPVSPHDLSAAIAAVTLTRAFADIYARARRHAVDAVHCLHVFPPSVYRQALEDLAYWIVDA